MSDRCCQGLYITQHFCFKLLQFPESKPALVSNSQKKLNCCENLQYSCWFVVNLNYTILDVKVYLYFRKTFSFTTVYAGEEDQTNSMCALLSFNLMEKALEIIMRFVLMNKRKPIKASIITFILGKRLNLLLFRFCHVCRKPFITNPSTPFPI